MERDVGGEDVCLERAIHPEHMLAVRQNLLPAALAGRVAEIFSVLGDPTRLQVVYALLSAPTGELCVCDLASGMGRDDTTISHQLRVLRNHKIVSMRKVGRVVYYRLIDEHVCQLLQLGMEHASESGEGVVPFVSTLRETEVPV
ncbi:MAG TPA: metalloregulator ArsR/SmtB family transcription factor [Ktedonobacteraceae bacterium]|nr:metalloregulator ArsR/SmtB family transcription factor [Ktedonobacteraceae bacterium]